MHSRRFGGESMMGMGGGMVSAESQRNLEIAEKLLAKRKPNDAYPYLVKAMEDGTNLDAYVAMAFICPTLDDSVECLEAGIRKGRTALKKKLGADVFDDSSKYAGRFWELLETRPYMRTLQAMVRIAFTNKKYSRSAEAAIEMLRLCPGDNLGQRDWLGSLLLKADRPADALYFAQAWLAPEADSGEPPHQGGTAFAKPSSEPVSAAREEEMSKWKKANLPYTAALASFKLFGDCPAARQYLRMAAKLNPIILIKILSKRQPPSDLNMNPRQLNGAEDAQDYLWLTQDLWTQPDVWSWADSDPNTKKNVQRICCREGCEKVESKVGEFKRCSACRSAWYCGQACQKSSWKAHKAACREHVAIKQTSKAFYHGKTLPSDAPIIATADAAGGNIYTRTSD